jgi:hypothetical protein
VSVSEQLQLFGRLAGDLDRIARWVVCWLWSRGGLAIRPGPHRSRDLPGTREDLLAAVAMLEDLGVVSARQVFEGDSVPTVLVSLADEDDQDVRIQRAEQRLAAAEMRVELGELFREHKP